jgi:hypothetical protein
MRKWLLALLLIGAVAGVLFVFRSPKRVVPAETGRDEPGVSISNFSQAIPRLSGGPSEGVTTSELRTQQPASVSIPAASSSVQMPATPATGQVDTLYATLPPTTIIENMRTTIRSFAAEYGENPVGTNPEIARALAGENPKQIVFLKPDGNRLNANGELVDPWGTAYFFHQLSGTEMEIRSAGPDKKMWTADDLVIK